MHQPKKKSFFNFIAILIIAITGILYLLADRYLIEHVEVTNVNPVVVAAAQAISTPAAGAQGSSTPAISTLAADVAGKVDVLKSIVADDWNYKSDTVSIAIKKVTTGSGSSTLTYYVADVVISDAGELKNAFAKNKFGKNIIEYTSQIAQEQNAIFAINGDYYGFRSDGIIIRNGVIYRDVPARTGMAFMKDGSIRVYDETQTSAQKLLAEGAWNTLSFGPALVENSVAVSNFSNVRVDTNLGQSIQGENPRTGVGIISNNHFVFVVADGRSTGYSRGVSLAEFAAIFKSLGCTTAYNMDGGGSSTMYFMGRVVNNPLGKNQERGTSDILYIGS